MIIEYEVNLDIVFIHTDRQVDRRNDIEPVFRAISEASGKRVIVIAEGRPNPFNPTVLGKFLEYLRYHEEDISIGENDFGDLREVFEEMFSRSAKYEGQD